MTITEMIPRRLRKLKSRVWKAIAAVGTIFLLCLAAGRCEAQEAERQSFAVASVKPASELPIIRTRPRHVGDSVEMSAPLGVIIQYAYHLLPNQIFGQIDSLHDFYVIEAKLSAPDADDERLRSMFRQLLEDRFRLRGHTEERRQSVYELIISKAGSKLRESASEGPLVIGGKTVSEHAVGNYGSLQAPRVVGHRASLSVLCDYLARELHFLVLDKTGLRGEFDFEFSYSKDESGPEGALGSTLTDALREQLGLKLTSAKDSVAALVIDHVERPSPN